MKTSTMAVKKKTSSPLAVKMLDSGVIEGYASIYGNVDRVGDRVIKGAFGDATFTVPLLAFHDDRDPVGSVECTPDDIGLFVKATFAPTARSQEIRELCKAGAIPAFSFGYRSLGEPNEYGGEDIYKSDTLEVSLTPIPANPLALVTAVKSMSKTVETEQKALAGSYEQLREDLTAALRDQYPKDAYPWVRATFDDQVVYEVWESGNYTDYRVGYLKNGDGSFTFGEPEAVKLEEVVTPVKAALDRVTKSLARLDVKATEADLVQAAHDSLVQAGATCDTVEVDDEKTLDMDAALVELELDSI